MDTEIMQAEAVETQEVEATAEVTTEAEVDPFEDGWGDDGLTDDSEDIDFEEAEEATKEPAEADQQEAETEDADKADDADTEDTVGKAEEPKAEAADELFDLKHFSGDRKVNREEVITLAQKGMDYDRKVGKLNDKIAEYEDFLKLLTPDGMDIDGMMDITRAKILVRDEEANGNELAESEALIRVQRQRSAKTKEAEDAAEAQKQQQRNASYNRFREAYPNVKPEDIPKSVWMDFEAQKGDLVDIYTRYENKQLKEQLEAAKQNEKNRARSTGSRKSAGASIHRDAFDEAWDNF